MNLYSGQWWTCRIENRLVEIEGEGEGGTNGDSNMETSTLSYVKLIVSGNLLYDSGRSNWCSVTT